MAIPEGKTASVSDLSRRLGISKGGVSKILATFRELGFVVQNEQTRTFGLGPTLISLGYQAVHRLDVRAIAKPYLQHLTDKYGENSMLMIAEGEQAIVIEQCEATRPIKLTMRVGECHPMYRGAAPKLLLAFMPENKAKLVIDRMKLVALTEGTITDKALLLERLSQIRAEGYCVSLGEIDSNAMAVAVPIRDAGEQVMAAIAISGPKNRMEEHDFSLLLKDLLQAAKEVSTVLGGGN